MLCFITLSSFDLYFFVIHLGCECSGHADRCHFDPAVFEASGRVSGGVCDDCQDNTMGQNCEMCKNYFYQDPSKQIWDREACLRKKSLLLFSNSSSRYRNKKDKSEWIWVDGRTLALLTALSLFCFSLWLRPAWLPEWGSVWFEAGSHQRVGSRPVPLQIQGDRPTVRRLYGRLFRSPGG